VCVCVCVCVCAAVVSKTTLEQATELMFQYMSRNGVVTL
jgi:hypothetical protein